jgi:hypothetical protein
VDFTEHLYRLVSIGTPQYRGDFVAKFDLIDDQFLQFLCRAASFLDLQRICATNSYLNSLEDTIEPKITRYRLVPTQIRSRLVYTR